MDTVKHVIWDWNGTLLDDVPACVSSLNDILSARGMPRVSIEDYQQQFGFPVKSFYTKLGLDFEQEDWDALAREYHDLYGNYAADAPLREGITRVLSGLRRRQIPMSVLSACESKILDRMVSDRDVDHYFVEVRGLHNLYAESKMHLGKQLLLELGASPHEVLFVGDTTHDFEVAAELGCSCVLLSGGHQSLKRLRKCDCPVFTETPKIIELFD
jgi:phosphoglycolate phosphatase